MIDQSISCQDTLAKFDENKMMDIVENKSKEILDLLNKDEDSELSHFDENDKMNHVEGSFYGEGSNRMRLGSNISEIEKRKKKIKPANEAFEYCIEEDVLSYRSSLHDIP
mmetsp:Transcript_15078/g.13234  ORF Transcript_15078/g.13234 Transcript_15078/m.13234 type:complete len:110 (+) Transcript_15078:616-945(+)